MRASDAERAENQHLTPELLDWARNALEALLRCPELTKGVRDGITHTYKRLDDLEHLIARGET